MSERSERTIDTVTDAVYDRIGAGYARHRRPDPRVLARILGALGDATSVVNVGAGTGSYEPVDRGVVAVEPSATMIAQRAVGAAPVVRGVADALPFPDRSFDAALAVMTVHHWPDPGRGLRELQRVAGRQVVLTFDFGPHDQMWWISEYLEEVARSWRHVSSVDLIAEVLGGRVEIVPLPADCTDGLLVAHWRNPERYLDPEVRAAASGTAMADPALVHAAVDRLAADLASGAWHERHADLLELDELDVGVRLIVADC